ncbi:division/cell wall cluster transcriptional repressor MraZ [Patescibacteria group bacterium]|nr:division/cell wall cluster transcriptional repressor MraZ [Patescibacteria group bacterium]
MFIGEYHHSVDEKGRLQVPVKWRSKLAEGAVLTKGFDGSLKFYPTAVWEGIASRLAILPQSQPQARAYIRQTLAGAVDLEVDKLGRVLLPPYLREYAGIVKQVVLAGLHDHIELWDEAAWNTYLSTIDQESPAFSQTLKEMGI